MFCKGSQATTYITIDDEVVGKVQLDVCEQCKAHYEQHGLNGAYSSE